VDKDSFIVINSSAPELNHLAVALAEASILKKYIRPYACQDRLWERIVKNFPGISNLYNKTFARRVLPPMLPSRLIHEAAVTPDVIGACLRHMAGKAGVDWSKYLHWRIQQDIERAGACWVREENKVVANYVVAKSSFEKLKSGRILNYPIAHHRFIQNFVVEESAREPEFAITLPDWSSVPSWIAPQLDMECEIADLILVGSDFVRDSFIKQGIKSEKLVVIPYGVNVMQFTESRVISSSIEKHADGGLHILFVGQIGQRKGISYLLKAYQRFRGYNTKLTLVGNYYGKSDALMPYRDLYNHIPHLPQTRLADVYRSADVFVFPSLLEGMPLVVLEAMASGLPVITTPNGPGDIVRDGIDGFVVPIRDPEAIVEKLEFLRSNPEQRLQMGQNARQRALEFTWQAYRDKVKALLLSL